MPTDDCSVTPRRTVNPITPLILVGALWLIYCGSLVLEFSPQWRYSRVAQGQAHIWTAAAAILAMMVLCGVFWKRSEFTRGPFAVGCLLGAAIAGITGWYLERILYHGAAISEKSNALVIFAGNGVLLLAALAITPLVLGVAKEAEEASNRSND